MKIENIESLLKGIKKGEIVLPDFQRSFVWEPDQIKELLVSVCAKYFIGSMLAIDSTKDDCEFQLRLFEGVKEVNPEAKVQNIIKIILDGQQRCTAIFYAIFQPDIPLKGRKNPYLFYLDIEKALEEKWDEAIVAVSKGDRKKLNEIRNEQANKKVISFKDLWDLDATTLLTYTKLPDGTVDEAKCNKLWKISQDLKAYTLHIVDIDNKEPEKIVEIFERINSTGEPLSVLDLLTAKLYKHQIKLRDLLEEAEKKYEFLKSVEPQAILKVITLIREEPPTRRNLLNLSPQNFEKDFDEACKLLEIAYKRIKDLKKGYGVLDFKKWTPYTSMIVPLAVMLKECKEALDYEKVDKWYWISVFDQRYDQAVDSQSYSDLKEMKNWIKRDEIPNFVKEFKPEDVDLEVSKQSNAIYRGVINLIVLKGALDFKTGQPPQFDPQNVQDDHIFPKSRYNEHRILNRTLITSNQSKINKNPSEFFGEKLKEFGSSKLLEIMESHLIPEKALEYLLNDHIEEFMKIRKETIIKEIKSKIGIS